VEGAECDVEEDAGEDDDAKEEGVEEGGQQPVTYRLVEF
jgi:hypothetical protein